MYSNESYAILEERSNERSLHMAQKNVLKYIILGLLAQQELAGYDIKKLFEGELGDFWYSNHSQIYPELQRMETGGIIDSFSKTIGQKLEKKFYRITDSGKALLREWLQEPLGDVAPTRDEFTMKLYLIQDAADPLIPELFAEEIARHEEKYQYLQARWQQLFATEEAQQRHYGHAQILQQAILREKQRLTWLHREVKKLSHEK
jgi:DNA-binding PadR family transcriptional regulator